jgi:long-chain acyl-CoA synthetase
MLFNCPEYVELLYAVWHAGLVVVPINAKLHRNEFEYILNNSGSKVCFSSPQLTEVAQSLTGEGMNTVIEVGSAAYDQLLDADPSPLTPRLPEDPAWLFYTSGTTGVPKGATLSHRNLIAMCHCYIADVDPVSPWSAILHAAPMSHGSGLYALAYVMQAGCHILPENAGFDCAEIYELIEHWPGVAFFAAPTMVRRLLDQDTGKDTSNLKAIVYGGGPMYVEDCREALDRFGPKLTQLYGQGESPMTITALNARVHGDNGHPRWLERLASVGVPQSSVELRIVDEEDNSLPVGEVGEVLVRGDSVMLGYWQDADATAESLRGGWLHTGDCGVLDEDGFLTLKDRAKDMIISGGSNIYPREVEEILLQHPGVAEVAVIGRPDRQWGEVVVAYIVVAEGEQARAAELDNLCTANMARFKRPKDYCFVEDLPKNNYGKVVKRALREQDGRR